MRKSKSDALIEDWRSTGRRRARGTLYQARVDFVCVGCGVTAKTKPKDAPKWFNDIWPEERREATQLQADHITKDLTSNNVDDLCWRCPSCHKLADIATEKGVAQVSEDATGYGAAYGGIL
jgi:hypothetical protein